MDDVAPTPAARAGTAPIGPALAVNRLGFGTMRLTGPQVWGPPADPAEARTVLRRAIDLGVTLIDTADAYGPHTSEELIAEALHPYPAGLVIATKGGLERPGPGAWTTNGAPEHLKRACEGSLRRLRLEQIPLYQLHRPDPAVPFEESVGALVELKVQGKIGQIGLSNVTASQLRAAQQLTYIASVQNRYNLLERSSEDVVELCTHESIAFFPWAPLDAAHGERTVAGIATRTGLAPAQVCIAWLLARGPTIVPIPGTSSVAHLESNVAAAAVALAPEDLAALDRTGRALRHRISSALQRWR